MQAPLQVRIYGMYPGNTWADGLRDTHPGWFANADVDQPKELYVGALYWSAVTIISVGQASQCCL